jgi:molybdopterin converting factor small subunit
VQSMIIEVNFTKSLADLAGTKDLQLELPGRNTMTLNEIYTDLIKKNPKLKDLLFESDGSFNYNILVFVNDKPVQNYEEKKLKLKNGDVISFFPIIGGG